MTDLDDRVRAGLTALAPEPARTGAHVVARARRARARRRYTLAAGAATVTTLVGVGVTAIATRDGDQPTHILDTDVSTTTPTAPDLQEVLTVPDLRGLTREQAVRLLSGLRFNPQLVEEPSDTVAEGLVTRTDPTAGTLQSVGATITIYVSSGLPAGVVPQLVALTTDAAIKAITDAGFVADARPVDVPPADPMAGRVVTQNPPAGSSATKGTTVQFTYGRPTN